MIKKMAAIATLAGLVLLASLITYAQGVPHFNTIGWTAPAGTITGYNVYRGTVAGGPYIKLTAAPITTTTYTDNNTAIGVKHFYVVTALDGTNESIFSNEASIVDVGTNVLPPQGLTVKGQ